MMDKEYMRRLSPNRNNSNETNNKVIYHDRFIPSRGAKNHGLFNSDHEDSLYKILLRNELFGENAAEFSKQPKLFTYKSPKKPTFSQEESNLSISPIGLSSQSMLVAPTKKKRTISKDPWMILDAPKLIDDFYLNLLDWSSQNLIAVGLEKGVYVWNALNNQVTALQNTNANTNIPNHSVTSLSWAEWGTHLAVGYNDGHISIWDLETQREIQKVQQGHNTRVGSLSWSNSPWSITSGSRDGTILHRDTRDHATTYKLMAHTREVCGLKWSDGSTDYLASGGNDNNIYIWDQRYLHNEKTTVPLWKLNAHQAAVKGLAWSPHQRGILASGGGTADQSIKIWNVKTGVLEKSVNTGSQVCNLAWSKNVDELVSTHGYCHNQVVIWSYSNFQQVTSLTGHSRRVLYLSSSPDGQTIVTGSGDETLRFWNVFPTTKSQKNEQLNHEYGLIKSMR